MLSSSRAGSEFDVDVGHDGTGKDYEGFLSLFSKIFIN